MKRNKTHAARRAALCLWAALLLAGLTAPWALAAPAAAVNTFSAAPDWDSPAQGILILDRDTGAVLYEKGADERVHPASTTKMMTALCALEEVGEAGLDQPVSIRAEVLEQLPDGDLSMAGLEAGQQLTVRQLLYCLLLSSGNDAAVVLADYAGGVAPFVERMNEWARQLGCTGTHFSNPHGLDEDSHYSTARDLARIAEAFLDRPVLAQIAATATYTLSVDGQDVTLQNSNLLLHPENELYDAGAVGVKTGLTPAGGCFVSAAQRQEDGLRFLCVVTGVPALDEQGQFFDPNPAVAEGRKLHQWVYDTFRRVTVCSADAPLTVTVDGVKEPVSALPEKTVTLLLPSAQADRLAAAFTPKADLALPLKTGDPLGAMTWTADGQAVTDPVALYAAAEVKRAPAWPLWAALAGAVLFGGAAAGLHILRRRYR